MNRSMLCVHPTKGSCSGQRLILHGCTTPSRLGPPSFSYVILPAILMSLFFCCCFLYCCLLSSSHQMCTDAAAVAIAAAAPVKRQAELFFPQEFQDDFPVSLQVSAKYGLIYVVTKLGMLFVYDLESATAVYRNRISSDPIFLTTDSPNTGGFYAINRCWIKCWVKRSTGNWPHCGLCCCIDVVSTPTCTVSNSWLC